MSSERKSQNKKIYQPEFKARVAIEAIKNEKPIAEICSENKISTISLHEWKDRVIARAKESFIPESEYSKKTKLLKQEIEDLHRVVGELTVENNYLKKKLFR